MCETCDYHSVSCYEDALKFMKKFLVVRILNLYTLYSTEKFESFLETYELPTTKFQDIILDFTTALTVLLNYESWVNDVDVFMEELQRLNIQHIIFGLEDHFPNSVREWAKRQKQSYREKPENLMEKFCNHLCCIDRFV